MPYMPWIFKSRAVSDWGYVFFELPFETEADARRKFNESKAHAKAHGGAGSLHHEGKQVEKFSIWCPND
jgi:hypothetical protein